ncbi:MAG: hypothetical protein Q8N30_01555 [Methylococcales bacterium]|nr:hypothetical protein [Methylococcales bacterium]
MSNLSRQELIKALETAEKNPRDKLGLAGEFSVVGLTGASSAALASSILATNTTTILTAPVLGSTILGKLLSANITVISKSRAPLIYIIAATVGGAILSYGLVKLIKSGSKSDKEIADYIKSLKEKITSYDSSVIDSTDNNTKVSKLSGIYVLLLKINAVTVEGVQTMFAGIENGSVDIDFALNNAKSMLEEIENA